MSSNSTNSTSAADSGGGSGQSGGSSELIIAIAALAISIVALIIAVLQALQQYFSSAEGYSSCNEKIIGGWSKFTKRKLIATQFRFEVRFRIPVIFVAPPQNAYGPLGDDDTKEIVYMDGSVENYRKTHTWTPEEFDIKQRAKLKGTDTRDTIHTADNEMTTWLALLMAIQRMERESREWQERICTPYVPIAPEEAQDRHTMAVGMQEKTRSWDTMPDGLKKPYATTAMCHMVEIMAMLGIYWKEFDRSKNLYRAQGNGFLVTGSLVPNLGVAFTFEKVGKTWFQENRIVPHDSVKQLCFGFCPTIFQAGIKTPLYTDEPKDEGTLQLGTPAEVAETLVSFGCNTNTVNYFRLGNENTRYSHLFPVTFEMLGMVGEAMQIHHTAFTMLPNPTYFTWNKSAFSLVGLMQALGRSLDEANVEENLLPRGSRLSSLRKEIDSVIAAATEDAIVKRRNDIFQADQRKTAEVKKMADARNHALRKRGPPRAKPAQPSALSRRLQRFRHRTTKTLIRMGVIPDPNAVALAKHQRQLCPDVQARETFPRYLETLHHAIKRCDLFLERNYDLVQHVFALHLQEVLCYLNSRPYSPDDEPHDTPVPSVGGPRQRGGNQSSPAAHHGRGRHEPHAAQTPHTYTPPSDNTEYYNEQYIPLHSIDTASWTLRHRLLMRLYVTFIRKRIAAVPIPDALSTYTQVRRGRETAIELARQDSSGLSALAEVAETESGSASASAKSTNPLVAAVSALSSAAASISATVSSSTAPSTASPAVASPESPVESPSSPTASREAPPGQSTTGANAAVAAREREKDTFTRPTTVRDIENIWFTLTFRMICWLMLHDFHKKDVQINKSDVYDSRLAVYIL
ncbi:short chain dehydrogenase reductase [Sporothrix brasiliensis 5110]|uniref:Short chain dehydrogenase reductase n=1 Tax=Sporothrix brasiliensis 5110 TaxID=1398154 RepID=A0A0C2F0P2_9PEZI|nr:short chain dehydrogenase reductase [Sporothrix brasiliensis 5110]KIH92384.1 short chain dehydrogenase reductase [Sporothrix brasiliensis 5110]